MHVYSLCIFAVYMHASELVCVALLSMLLGMVFACTALSSAKQACFRLRCIHQG